MGLAFPKKKILKQDMRILHIMLINMAYYIGLLAKITKLGLIYHIRSYNTIPTKDDATQMN
jgi:hypothetical protein